MTHPDAKFPELELPEFTCERCGYVYKKQKDYAPFLCHRCTRYISKKVFSLMNQIVPTSHVEATQEI